MIADEFVDLGLRSPTRGAELVINGWLQLDLHLEDDTTRAIAAAAGSIPVNTLPGPMTGPGTVISGVSQHQFKLMEVGQSYILLKDKSSLLATMPAYASPAVRAAISLANPFQRALDLAEAMALSVERLVAVVGQLVEWKIARVVEKFDGAAGQSSSISRFIGAPTLAPSDFVRFTMRHDDCPLLSVDN